MASATLTGKRDSNLSVTTWFYKGKAIFQTSSTTLPIISEEEAGRTVIRFDQSKNKLTDDALAAQKGLQQAGIIGDDEDGYGNYYVSDDCDLSIGQVAAANATVLSTTKGQQNKSAAKTDYNNSTFQSVSGGYGDVPNRSTIQTLVGNVKGYGNCLASLVYPADLLSGDKNNHAYDGNFTVIFISEHQDSKISSVIRNSNSSNNYIKNAGSAIDSTKANPKAVQTIATVAGVFAGSTAGQKLAGSLYSMASSTLTGGSSGNTPTVVKILSGLAGAAAGGAGAYTLSNKAEYVQLKTAIALPTPTVVDQHTLQWNDSSAAIGGGILAGLEKLGDANTSNFSLANEVAQAAILGSAGIANSSDTISRYSGKAANTRPEQIFKGVDFRSYTLEFALAARSQAEVDSIESIIRVLKFHAYPELSPSTFLYIYPAQFDVVHYFNDTINTHMPRHATSVLKSITVDYSGGNQSMQYHSDGSPVIINLKLDFVEIAILNKDSIRKGY